MRKTGQRRLRRSLSISVIALVAAQAFGAPHGLTSLSAAEQGASARRRAHARPDPAPSRPGLVMQMTREEKLRWCTAISRRGPTARPAHRSPR
jgi:hypothetical protein